MEMLRQEAIASKPLPCFWRPSGPEAPHKDLNSTGTGDGAANYTEEAEKISLWSGISDF